MNDLDRDRTPLTDNERRMIFNAHQYFFDVRQCQNQQQTLTLRKQVATVLGVGKATVARVVSEQNKKKIKNSQLKKNPVALKNTLIKVSPNLFVDLLQLPIPLEPQFQQIYYGRNLRKIIMNSQSGSYCVYFIYWGIIMVRVNGETCCINHQ
jgi:hypothetical protein